MARLKRSARLTFRSLTVANYRRYYTGQAISLTGTWMQMAAQAWLVLSITHSTTILGAVIALQTVPILLIGPYGGVVADRVDKLRLMIGLQSAMGLQALALGVLTALGAERVWEVALLAMLLGITNAFENPIRQSFMLELVGREHLRNAISLNSTLVNLARTTGPAIGGVLIAVAGEAPCFLINAASFLAVLISLTGIDRTALNPSPPATRASGQLRDGLRYVRSSPELAVPLLMMALAGTLAYEFQVSLPAMADGPLHVGAAGYGAMTAAMGFGAVIGGLLIAAIGRTGIRPLIAAALLFGLVLALAAVAQTFWAELLALSCVGWASIAFMATGNSSLQLAAAPNMRGRVMSLWFVAFQGSTPVGGPLIGWVIADFGARMGLGVGALTCLVVAAIGLLGLRRHPGSLDGTAPALVLRPS